LCARSWKKLIVYHKSNGITTMKKHVDAKHNILIRAYVSEQTNYLLSESMDHELIKKITFRRPIINFGFFAISN
jgi:hypothetical protein